MDRITRAAIRTAHKSIDDFNKSARLNITQKDTTTTAIDSIGTAAIAAGKLQLSSKAKRRIYKKLTRLDKKQPTKGLQTPSTNIHMIALVYFGTKKTIKRELLKLAQDPATTTTDDLQTLADLLTPKEFASALKSAIPKTKSKIEMFTTNVLIPLIQKTQNPSIAVKDVTSLLVKLAPHINDDDTFSQITVDLIGRCDSFSENDTPLFPNHASKIPEKRIRTIKLFLEARKFHLLSIEDKSSHIWSKSFNNPGLEDQLNFAFASCPEEGKTALMKKLNHRKPPMHFQQKDRKEMLTQNDALKLWKNTYISKEQVLNVFPDAFKKRTAGG
jgi:hypothetical protein